MHSEAVNVAVGGMVGGQRLTGILNLQDLHDAGLGLDWADELEDDEGAHQRVGVPSCTLYLLYRCIGCIAVSDIDTARQGECAVSSVTWPKPVQLPIQQSTLAPEVHRHGRAAKDA